MIIAGRQGRRVAAQALKEDDDCPFEGYNRSVAAAEEHGYGFYWFSIGKHWFFVCQENHALLEPLFVFLRSGSVIAIHLPLSILL
jgi:hypothetical protein